MSRALDRGGRAAWPGWIVALAAGLTVLCTSAAPPAEAAVVCQRKQKVRLRAEACKKKETLVLDLAQLEGTVGDQGGRLDGADGDIAALDDTAAKLVDSLGLECRGDPSRALVSRCPGRGQVAAAGFSPRCGGEEGGCNGACRLFDGDEAGCNAAFQAGYGGGSACVYLDGRCFGCGDCAQAAGRCFDACEPQDMCADATRTRFMGGPNTRACQRLLTKETCVKAWSYSDVTPTSCFWDGVANRCRGCAPPNQADFGCQNSCVPPIDCADPGRSIGLCYMQGGQPACEATWESTGKTGVACYWDGSSCNRCDTFAQLVGDCTDGC